MGRSAPLIPGGAATALALGVALGALGCGEPVSILGDTPGLMRIVAGVPDDAGRDVGNSATETLLWHPAGVDMDLDGVLYLADRDNRRILAVSSSGAVRVVVSDLGCTALCLAEPVALALDGAGRLIVADDRGHRVWRFDAGSGARTLLAGTGESETTPDGEPAATSPIRSPRGVAVDENGLVYFAEGRSHRVRAILADGTLSTVAGTGESGFAGDGGPATEADIYFPGGIEIANGVLYIADAGNQRVRAVDLVSGIISTIAGTGASGFGGDGGPALSAALSDPRDVAVTSDGLLLYIADRGNHRIRAVSLATGLINTAAGSGDTEFAGNLIDAGAAGLSSPIGVGTSPFGLVLIADTDHHIVWRTPTGF
jgi:sugar lactone lactonase YvrE